jgi:hypothetical protein
MSYEIYTVVTAYTVRPKTKTLNFPHKVYSHILYVSYKYYTPKQH